MRLFRCFLLTGVLALVLLGCSSEPNYAPVVSAWPVPSQSATYYRVRQGDTLYAIAWRFEQDYRDIARWNRLKPPYVLDKDERLRVKTPTGERKSKKAQKVAHNPKKASTKRTKSTSKVSYKRTRVSSGPVHWRWPAKGKIIQGFNLKSGGNKGINIRGRRGQTVRAAAAGQVAYAGNGLKGYGNLLIIKHTRTYFSAYAYNRRLLVKEGSQVKAGQKIALMGSLGTQPAQLHFEIRRAGKPVNPLRHLPTRK